MVEVNGFKCRVFFDIGVGSLYASSVILDYFGIRLVRKEFKRIEMMFGFVNKVIGVYGVTINSFNGKFRLETEVIKVDRGILLLFDNSRYVEVIEKYFYFIGIYMSD